VGTSNTTIVVFDVPTRYLFGIWYYFHTQRGWST